MLFASLILLKRGTILVIAQQSEMEALALLNGRRARGPSHYQAMVFDARKVLESFQLLGEAVLVLFGDVGSEFEEDWNT